MVTGAGNKGGGQRGLDAQKAAQRIMSLIANKELIYLRGEIIRRYNEDFRAAIGEGRLPRLDHALYDLAVKSLAREKKVELLSYGNIKFYNQAAAIKEASLRLTRALVDAGDLHALAETVARATAGLFRNFDLYLRDARSGELVLIAGQGQALEIGRTASGLASRFQYLPWPDESISCVEPLRAGAGGIVVNLSEGGAASAGSRPHLYSANVEVSRHNVNHAIKELVGTIAERSETIVTANQGLTLQEIWQKEEKDDRGLVLAGAEQQGAVAAPKKKVPGLGERGYDKWVNRNELAMSKFYERSTWIFSYICRLSRGYQVSVLEGIERAVADLKQCCQGQPINYVDAGVGNAYFLERFMRRAAQENLDVRATAIDISKAATTIAKAAVKKEFGGRVTVTKGNLVKMTRFIEDGDALPLGSQHLVTLNYVLQYVPIEQAFLEINRVLAPGGRLLITNFKPKESMRWNEFWTNLRAARECGRQRMFGHGQLYEVGRYLLMFLRHPVAIVWFAMAIDRDVRRGIIPANPDQAELAALLERYGFRLRAPAEETHQQAAYRFYAEKIRDAG